MERTYRIIVGVDGSDSGQRALNWATVEAAHRGRAGQPVAVQAVTAWQDSYVLEPMGAPVRMADPAAVAAGVLDSAVAVARAIHPEVAIAGEAVRGEPADILVRTADDADLLVLGSHGHSRIYQAVLGSVAESCVRAATCPVVIIPVARSSSTSFAGESLVTTAS